MGEMFEMHHMPGPPNYLPFGSQDNLALLRWEACSPLSKYEKASQITTTGWYQNPPGTVAETVETGIKYDD